MKASKTLYQIRAYDKVASEYLEKNKGAENKLCVAIRSFSKQVVKIYEEYNERLEELRLDFCSVDEKTKTILKDDKGERLFTVENTRAFNKKHKEILQESVTIHSRIPLNIDDLVKTLTELEREMFSEFIIPKQEEKDEIEFLKNEEPK